MLPRCRHDSALTLMLRAGASRDAAMARYQSALPLFIRH